MDEDDADRRPDPAPEPEARADGEGVTVELAHDDDLRDYVSIYLKGAAMGAADAVPGVSGGTIALVTGIYERLIAAITDFEPSLLADLTRVHTAAGRRAFLDRLSELDLGFLLALGFGVATALVTVSRVLEVALDEYTALTFAFFFGLIAASAVVLYGQVSVATPRLVAVAVAGFAVAFVLTGELTAVLPNSPLVAVFAGAIAVSAMILPGISGSFLLLVMGQYEYVFGSISGFTDALLARDPGALIGQGVVIVSFGIGAVIGLLTLSRVIEYALSNYRTATLTFLVSLMVGALRLPVERVLAATETFTPEVTATLVVAAVVGGALVLVLDHVTAEIL
jgi:putative membrane protein